MASNYLTLISVALLLFLSSYLKIKDKDYQLTKSARWLSVVFLAMGLGVYTSVLCSAQYDISLLGAISVCLLAFEMSLLFFGGVVHLIPPREMQDPPRYCWDLSKYAGIVTCLLLLIWTAQASKVAFFCLCTLIGFAGLLLLIHKLSGIKKRS